MKNEIEEYLTIEQVAEKIGCSVRYLHEEIKKKNLRAYKPGKRLVFDPEDVQKWIKKKAV